MTIAKQHIGTLAAGLVQPRMRLGLGTGSTAEAMVRALALRVKNEGLSLAGAVATSERTAQLARSLGIAVGELRAEEPLDLYLDGADEIDPQGNLIKGGGGAHLREKLVAAHAKRRAILVDDRKTVTRLGLAFPLPVEVVRFGHDCTAARITDAIPGTLTLRRNSDGTPFLTDEGHYLYDLLPTGGIAGPPATDRTLKGILGVVETGLFCGMTDQVVIGTTAGASLYALDEWKARQHGEANA